MFIKAAIVKSTVTPGGGGSRLPSQRDLWAPERITICEYNFFYSHT